jgi:hypothetical protein
MDAYEIFEAGKGRMSSQRTHHLSVCNGYYVEAKALGCEGRVGAKDPDIAVSTAMSQSLPPPKVHKYLAIGL